MFLRDSLKEIFLTKVPPSILFFFSTFMKSFVDWSSESLQIRSFKVSLLKWFVLKLEIPVRIKYCLLLPLVMSLSSPINFLIILLVEIVHFAKIEQTQRKCNKWQSNLSWVVVLDLIMIVWFSLSQHKGNWKAVWLVERMVWGQPGWDSGTW